MKTWNKYQLPFIGWATLLMRALLIGCASEDDFDKGVDAMQALAISPQVIDSNHYAADRLFTREHGIRYASTAHEALNFIDIFLKHIITPVTRIRTE